LSEKCALQTKGGVILLISIKSWVVCKNP